MEIFTVLVGYRHGGKHLYKAWLLFWLSVLVVGGSDQSAIQGGGNRVSCGSGRGVCVFGVGSL